MTCSFTGASRSFRDLAGGQRNLLGNARVIGLWELSMFKPFTPGLPGGATAAPEPDASAAPAKDNNIDDLRAQMKEMQERLERMSKKEE